MLYIIIIYLSCTMHTMCTTCMHMHIIRTYVMYAYNIYDSNMFTAKNSMLMVIYSTCMYVCVD